MPLRAEKPAVRRASPLLLIPVVVGAVLWSGACTTQRVASPGAMDGMGPLLTVERFLQAANSRDYEAMASLFGTVDGPFEGERTDVEVQMDLISRILRHQDYSIASEGPVPGRQHPTTRVGVDLDIEGERVPDVGFLVVQSNQGRWLVEEIDLEAITNR